MPYGTNAGQVVRDQTPLFSRTYLTSLRVRIPLGTPEVVEVGDDPFAVARGCDALFPSQPFEHDAWSMPWVHAPLASPRT